MLNKHNINLIKKTENVLNMIDTKKNKVTKKLKILIMLKIIIEI